MGPGVTAADDGPRVTPDLHPQRAIVGRSREPARRPEPGAELVGDDDVEERIEGVLAPLGRDVGDAAAGVGAGLLGEGLDQLQDGPVGEAPQHARLVGRRPRGEPPADTVIAESPDPLGDREREDLPPARKAVERRPGEEAHPHAVARRQRQRDHPGAPAPAALDAASCCSQKSRLAEETPSTFQLIGRLAEHDIDTIRSISAR